VQQAVNILSVTTVAQSR